MLSVLFLLLFSPAPQAAHISHLQRAQLFCPGGRFAFRQFEQNGEKKLLLVQLQSLKTSVVPARSLRCTEAAPTGYRSTLYFKALGEFTSKLPRNLDGSEKSVFANFGFQRFPVTCSGKVKPMVLSSDLCPSLHPVEKEFLAKLASKKGKRFPLALAVSGRWLRDHKAELAWIRSLDLDITYVNHSNVHPYVHGRPYERNFLTVATAAQFQRDLLEAEQEMLENGIVPSVFFRFPGLMSTAREIAQLRQLGLIPLATSAWLAIDGSVNKPDSDYYKADGTSGFLSDQKARAGSVILTHSNGNEHAGVVKAAALFDERNASESFVSVEEAVSCALAGK